MIISRRRQVDTLLACDISIHRSPVASSFGVFPVRPLSTDLHQRRADWLVLGRATRVVSSSLHYSSVSALDFRLAERHHHRLFSPPSATDRQRLTASLIPLRSLFHSLSSLSNLPLLSCGGRDVLTPPTPASALFGPARARPPSLPEPSLHPPVHPQLFFLSALASSVSDESFTSVVSRLAARLSKPSPRSLESSSPPRATPFRTAR